MTDDEHIAVLTVLDPDLEQLAAYPAHSTAELAKRFDGSMIVRSHSGIVLGRIAPGDAKAVMMEIDNHGGSAILCGIDTTAASKGGAAVVTFDRQTYAQRRGVAAQATPSHCLRYAATLGGKLPSGRAEIPIIATRSQHVVGRHQSPSHVEAWFARAVSAEPWGWL